MRLPAAFLEELATFVDETAAGLVEQHGVPLRRAEQALLELLDSASNRLLLVSYAIHRVPSVWMALAHALERGARLDVVLESAEENECRLSVDALAQLHELLGPRARFWIWPRYMGVFLRCRPQDKLPEPQSLVVLCAAAGGSGMAAPGLWLYRYAGFADVEGNL